MLAHSIQYHIPKLSLYSTYLAKVMARNRSAIKVRVSNWRADISWTISSNWHIWTRKNSFHTVSILKVLFVGQFAPPLCHHLRPALKKSNSYQRYRDTLYSK